MTWQQSIVLLLTGKIDVLEEYDAEVSSPSLTLKIPAVARLRAEISMHKGGVKFSRSNVYARDGFRCCYCPPLAPRRKPTDLTYDHVVPRCQGGKTVWDNIVTACKACNARKGDRTPQQAGMRMRFRPHRPTTVSMGQPVLVLRGGVPEVWQPYLEGAVQSA